MVNKIFQMNNKFTVLFILASAILSGCASMKESTEISNSVISEGITVENSLPSALPKKSATIEHSLYVMILSESAAGRAAVMLVPVPFVGDMAMSAMDQNVADSYEEKYKDRYISINPYTITLDAVKGKPLFREGESGFTLHPFVFITESTDESYRASLVYHVENKDWNGRYLYHLPTPVSIEDAENPTPEKIEAFRKELVTGARTLVELIERDAQGKLSTTGKKVDFGSLHIIGSDVLGMVSAESMHFKNADLVEEGDDYVIFRQEGDMEVEGQSGALLFGVHYFRKELLHTFEILEPSSDQK